MANAATPQLHWSQKLRFHVAQAKHSAATGNFTYFHVSRAQYIANGVDHVAILKASDVPKETLDKLVNINVSSVEICEVATTEFEHEIKHTKVEEKLEENAKKKEWRRVLTEKTEAAKKKVNDALDAGLEVGMSLIDKLPESAQDASSSMFAAGIDVIMGAFEVLVAKLLELFKAITDFIRGIWTAVEAASNVVSDKVSSAVSWLFSWTKFEQTDGIDDATAPSGSQATQLLLSLVYNFRVPDEEITASANRIWEAYRARYSQATSEQEPQNVTLSSKPKAEGLKNTDGKSMFISWQVDDAGSGNGRELMDPVCRSEEKAMARFCSGALRHSVVDMANHSDGTQYKQGVGNQENGVLQSDRNRMRKTVVV